MSDSTVNIKIPDELVRAAVMAKLEDEIGGETDGGSLLATVVAEKLCKADRYSNRPLWEKWLAEYIEKVAKEIFAEILEDRKPAIKKALAKKLTGTKLGDKLANALVGSCNASYFKIDVRLSTNNPHH